MLRSDRFATVGQEFVLEGAAGPPKAGGDVFEYTGEAFLLPDGSLNRAMTNLTNMAKNSSMNAKDVATRYMSSDSIASEMLMNAL